MRDRQYIARAITGSICQVYVFKPDASKIESGHLTMLPNDAIGSSGGDQSEEHLLVRLLLGTSTKIEYAHSIGK